MDEFCKYDETYSAQQQKSIAEEFRRLAGEYYLEHAGATLYSEKQLHEVVRQLSENLYANPHAKNLSSKLTEDAVDIVRYQILTHFKTNPQEYSVIFTSGATAALKLISESFTYETDNGVFAYLQDNHTSVLGMRAYAKRVKCIQLNDVFNALSQDVHYVEPNHGSNSLFVFPAQSNFSGLKYPLAWIERVQKGALNKLLETDCQNWFVALDAASYASTNELDLSLVKPDFVAISFYKIFGYPTGLGALLVKNSSCQVLKKKYYGGGTVLMAQTLENMAVMREIIHERFEDGTIPFLSILALREGFNTLKRLNLTFDTISKHTFSLAQCVYKNLLCLHHSNGKPAVILYHNTTFEDVLHQGAIINFNLLRENGEYVGYAEVLNFANLFGIHLRTGCFCNPGACQHFLKMTPEDVKKHFDAGHVCGDQHDLVDGCPTGSVRVSFGYMSTKKDADKFLEMIENCFVTKPLIKKIPENYKLWQKKYRNLFSTNQQQIIKNFENIDNYNNNEINNGDLLTNPRNYEEGTLQQIILYPVKSCGGFSVLDKWPITSTGLKYDRQWMVMNSSGVCLTQKNNKKLCLIRPTINLETKMLLLSYKGYKKIHVPIDVSDNIQNSASLCQSKVCGDNIQGWDCGDDVADWLSEVLECPGVRLLKQCSENEEIISRTSRKNEQLRLSLANKAQYLLINEASVEWLRDRIPEHEFKETLAITIQRFRPNFVVKFSEAFVENDYEEFVLDNVIFKTGGVCTRCQMICIDQTTGKTSKEPLQTLAKSFKGKISFGVYLNRPENDTEPCLYVGCKAEGTRSSIDEK